MRYILILAGLAASLALSFFLSSRLDRSHSPIPKGYFSEIGVTPQSIEHSEGLKAYQDSLRKMSDRLSDEQHQSHLHLPDSFRSLIDSFRLTTTDYNKFLLKEDRLTTLDNNIASSALRFLKPLIIFLFMLLGMFGFQIYIFLQKYEATDTPVPFRSVLREGLRGPKFLMAVVVSPIIFYATYKFLGGTTDNLTSCVVSFQNGFFWITIFNAKVPKERSKQKTDKTLPQLPPPANK